MTKSMSRWLIVYVVAAVVANLELSAARRKGWCFGNRGACGVRRRASMASSAQRPKGVARH